MTKEEIETELTKVGVILHFASDEGFASSADTLENFSTSSVYPYGDRIFIDETGNYLFHYNTETGNDVYPSNFKKFVKNNK